jgi:hypothetical protein
MNYGYIKLNRGPATEELMKEPDCYMLLSVIAYRARRTQDFNVQNLKLQEALIGDYQSVGLTRQRYRTALKKLVKWGYITTRTTNKGTIATLLNSSIFDINSESGNQQVNQPPTNGQPSSNHQATTNNKDKKDKNGKKEKSSLERTDVFELLPESIKIHFIERTGVNGSVSDSFTEGFLKYAEYRKTIHADFVNLDQVLATIDVLLDVAQKNCQDPIPIMQQTMAYGWTGFYRLNTDPSTVVVPKVQHKSPTPHYDNPENASSII